MKFSVSILTLSLVLSATATPLGNHALFKKHTGVPANNARRYILQSRMDAPPACVAKASASASPSTIQDLNSTVVDPSLAVPDNSTVVDPTLDAANSTVVDSTLGAANSTTVDPTLQVPNNSTVVDPTVAAGNSTTIDDTTNADDSVDAAAADDTGATDDVAADNTNSTDTPRRRRRRRRRLRRTFSHISNVAHPNIVHASVIHPNVIQSSVVHSNTVQLDLTGFAFEWQNICLQSGGLDVFTEHSPCIDFSGGISALLADADPCAQQDMADSMITFAKGPGIINKVELIDYAVRYRSHPRVPVNILGVVPSSLYCQRAPLNVELLGVVNTQMENVNPGLFGAPDVPMVPFGADGTCPFGTVPDVSTCTCTEDPSALNVTDTGNATALADPTATATDSVAVDVATTTDSAAIDTATATDSAAATATDSTVVDAATATDSAAALATDDANANVDSSAAVTDGSQPTATADAAAAASSDVNFQPADIDGDVNDING